MALLPVYELYYKDRFLGTTQVVLSVQEKKETENSTVFISLWKKMEAPVDCPTPQSRRWLNLVISALSSPAMPDQGRYSKDGWLRICYGHSRVDFFKLRSNQGIFTSLVLPNQYVF